VIEAVKVASLFVGLIVGILTLYKIISPCFKKKKLRRFYELVQEWFDEIDKNLESGINLPVLENMEKRIGFYIEENNISNYKIKISKKIIRKYLKKHGLVKKLQNSTELFYKYSRCNSRIFNLKDFWNSLQGAFIKFYPAYKKGNNCYNYADIEMRVKFLRQFLKIKEK